MGIELPAELRDAAARAGARWPEGDEDAMRESATAWREAARSLDALARDADASAQGVLAAFEGDAARAARREWDRFVTEDGELPRTAAECVAAADRLDHAAEQIGAAKVRMVRELVALAKSTDAAEQAAAAGHPQALGELDAAVRRAAAGLAQVHETLTRAVDIDSGVTVDSGGALDLASGALSIVDSAVGAGGNVLSGASAAAQDALTPVAQTAESVSGQVEDLAAEAAPVVEGAGGLAGDASAELGRTTAQVGDAVAGSAADVGGAVQAGAEGVAGAVDQAVGAAGQTADGVGQAADGAGQAADGVGQAVGAAGQAADGVGQGPGRWQADAEHTGPIDIAAGSWASGLADAGTGPVPVAGAQPGWAAPGDDPASTTAPHSVHQAWASPPSAPSGAAAPPPPAPGAPAPQGFAPPAGGHFVPPPGGAAPGAPGAQPSRPPVAPPRPPGYAPPQQQPQPQQPPQQQQQPQPQSKPANPGSPAVPVHHGQGGPPPRQGNPGPGQYRGGPGFQGQPGPQGPPAGYQGHGHNAHSGHHGQQPQHPRMRPGGGQLQPPLGAHPEPPPRVPRRNERDPEVLAFVLHQFPIGHMPVAASRASTQVCREEADAAGRFPPQDHPRADLVDDTDALARVRARDARGGADLERADPERAPEELVTTHDPLGELSEIEWERQYVTKQGDHVWPPVDARPEGGVEAGEPVVLPPDEVVDRIGDGEGRVLSAVATAFSQRSQPPAYLERAYRRYRVLRELPVWQSVAAPWFGQPGGGVRYRTTYPVDDLVALGYLVELTAELETAEAQTLRIYRAQAAAEEDVRL
ncbi:glycohydrolase toxin TNT-related protein [Saccharopolyspora erythraea]|uniref:glycohydrolase toxin TNT-related protein n=1 Tax=Saccharopolyspora erythraea TaxID=1836 RepID=UPI001BAA3558|nr:glycohydrolase toxin TNT-related protein [Saccharopolyspora erythraea]QUH04885.1 glycohydrolase toxin TNT-related protein [Saccharopolyspora erythraea]